MVLRHVKDINYRNIDGKEVWLRVAGVYTIDKFVEMIKEL